MLGTPGTSPGRGLCLEPHDLVVSKLVASREKEQEFAAGLISAGLVHAQILYERINLLAISDSHRELLHDWVAAAPGRTRGNIWQISLSIGLNAPAPYQAPGRGAAYPVRSHSA